jgi:hypothetical protein
MWCGFLCFTAEISEIATQAPASWLPGFWLHCKDEDLHFFNYMIGINIFIFGVIAK